MLTQKHQLQVEQLKTVNGTKHKTIKLTFIIELSPEDKSIYALIQVELNKEGKAASFFYHSPF